MREKPLKSTVGYGLGLCMLFSAAAANGEPIKNIFVDYSGSDPAPLQFTADLIGGQSTLSVEIPSLTVVVTRIVGGNDVPEFIENASFSLTATALNDMSAIPLAAGIFDSVEFTLRDGNNDVLLAGEQLAGADLLYSESLLTDVMFLNSGPIAVTSGLLAADFNVQANVFGIGFDILPGTDTFDLLDTDHGGSVKITLFPVPEPTSLAIFSLAIGWGAGRRRRTYLAR